MTSRIPCSCGTFMAMHLRLTRYRVESVLRGVAANVKMQA
jgi:hypothetical protein